MEIGRSEKRKLTQSYIGKRSIPSDFSDSCLKSSKHGFGQWLSFYPGKRSSITLATEIKPPESSVNSDGAQS